MAMIWVGTAFSQNTPEPIPLNSIKAFSQIDEVDVEISVRIAVFFLK